MSGSRKPARCAGTAPTEPEGVSAMMKKPETAKARVAGFWAPPLALAVFVSRPQAELKSARAPILGRGGTRGKAQYAATQLCVSVTTSRRADIMLLHRPPGDAMR